MARKTAEEKAADAAFVRQQDAQAETDLAIINAFEEEAGRPPTKDELADKRAARATAEADRALEAEMGGHQGDPDAGTPSAAENGNGNSGSISERAAQGPPVVEEDDEGQTFFYMGEEVTLANLLKRVKKISVAWKFTGKRQKGKGALPKLDGDIFLIMRSKPGNYNVVPTRDDQEATESVTIEVKVDPRVINDAMSEDGRAMMADLLRQQGYTVEPPAAAESVAS